MPAAAESARRTSPVCSRRPRNDSSYASVACAHRTQMTGRGNVASAVISDVLPTFGLRRGLRGIAAITVVI